MVGLPTGSGIHRRGGNGRDSERRVDDFGHHAAIAGPARTRSSDSPRDAPPVAGKPTGGSGRSRVSPARAAAHRTTVREQRGTAQPGAGRGGWKGCDAERYQAEDPRMAGGSSKGMRIGVRDSGLRGWGSGNRDHFLMPRRIFVVKNQRSLPGPAGNVFTSIRQIAPFLNSSG